MSRRAGAPGIFSGGLRTPSRRSPPLTCGVVRWGLGLRDVDHDPQKCRVDGPPQPVFGRRPTVGVALKHRCTQRKLTRTA